MKSAKYKCPKCGAVNSAQDWNKTTQELLQDDEGIVIIERIGKKTYLDFFCPNCKKDSNCLEIEKVYEK